jgi:hypothetical protein
MKRLVLSVLALTVSAACSGEDRLSSKDTPDLLHHVVIDNCEPARIAGHVANRLPGAADYTIAITIRGKDQSGDASDSFPIHVKNVPSQKATGQADVVTNFTASTPSLVKATRCVVERVERVAN